MSADGKSPVPGPDSLQFDVAESSAAADESSQLSSVTTCRSCSRPITSAYYQVNDVIVCDSCRRALDHPPGTPLRRALRATGLGLLAATGGSLLYFAVAAITGREFGLVAIVVGYTVAHVSRHRHELCAVGGEGISKGWCAQRFPECFGCAPRLRALARHITNGRHHHDLGARTGGRARDRFGRCR